MSNNTQLHPNQNQLIGLLICASILFSGCTSVPPPLELIAVSKAAINDANVAGANELAPVQYKSAIEKFDGAQVAMSQKDYSLAKQLAEQAQIDAKLSVAIARASKAKKAADALQEDNRVLSLEIGRKTK